MKHAPEAKSLVCIGLKIYMRGFMTKDALMQCAGPDCGKQLYSANSLATTSLGTKFRILQNLGKKRGANDCHHR